MKKQKTSSKSTSSDPAASGDGVSTRRKKLLIAALVITLIGTIGFGYRSWQLAKERNQLIADLDAERHRFKLLQKKYAEQKALTTSIQRAKLGVEGQLAKTRKELDAVKAENEAIQLKLADMEKEIAKKTAHLEKRIQNREARIKRLLDIQEKYKAKLEEAVTVARERHAKILKLEDENADLTANLQEKTSGLKRCEEHNTRLSQLAEEVLQAYYDKGVGTSLVQAEPFTKLKQVELEQIVQEYLDRIDQDNMELIKEAAN